MNSSNFSIQVQDVSKTFYIPHEKKSTLRERLFGFFKRTEYERFSPLKHISFTVTKGQTIGIIGPNGSGKSTVLKLLAGIYQPDAGQITVNGKLSAFLELGIGFHPDLTARENVFLNGGLLGMTKKEIAEKLQTIVEYAGVERFLDQQLKNFSSGMQVRLAFSVAIQTNFDVLLLDEVLAVGDFEFQQKCYRYFDALKTKREKTIVLVTHDLDLVEKYCDQVYLLRNGAWLQEATKQKTIELYRHGS